VTGTYDTIAERFAEAWGGLADSVTISMPEKPLVPGSQREADYLAMLERMRSVPTTRDV
jgi:hypothetical protein